MIKFHCPSCRQNYSVPDERAGQGTRCAKCGNPLKVPERCDVEVLEDGAEVGVIPKRPRRPPAKVVLALITGVLVILFSLVAFLDVLIPPRSKVSVERSLRERLPPGYEDFRLDSFDPKTSELKFSLKYRDYGDLIGVTYEVRDSRTSRGL